MDGFESVWAAAIVSDSQNIVDILVRVRINIDLTR